MDKRIERWMRDSVLDQKRPCVEFRLEHLITSAKETSDTVIDTARIDPDVDKEGQIQATIARFEDTIESRSQEFRGAQRYAVVALGEGDRLLGQQSFRIKPVSEMIDTGESEPANHAGIVGLELRGSESLLRMTLAGYQAMTEQQNRIVGYAFKRIADLEEDRMKSFDALEEMRGKQHEREMEFAALQSSESRKDRLFDRAGQALAPMLPGMAKRLGLLPAKPEQQQADKTTGKVLKAFVEGLSEEQQTTIFGSLKPEQVSMLLTLMPDEDGTDGDVEKKVKSNVDKS